MTGIGTLLLTLGHLNTWEILICDVLLISIGDLPFPKQKWRRSGVGLERGGRREGMAGEEGRETIAGL